MVGQAGDGDEALEVVAEHRPDVVLMDLRMPGVGGLEATARIRVEHPDIAVVVLTMDGDDDSVFAALRAGARGYLLKEADGDDIERAIAGVAARRGGLRRRGRRAGAGVLRQRAGQAPREPVPAADRRASTRCSS